MADWDISGTATLPPEADDLRIRYIGLSNSGGYANQGMPGEFNFVFDDTSGPLFFLIFELLDSAGDPISAQPIIHGPYSAPDVGAAAGGGKD